MKILVDLVSVSGGGGAEQSISFLSEVCRAFPEIQKNMVCVVRAESRVESHAKDHGFTCELVNQRLLSRVYYTLLGGRRVVAKHNIDVIYVAFGIGISVPREIVQVINVALPIVCYWDSPYWVFLPFIERQKRAWKARIRSFLIKRRASLVLVESEVMRSRLQRALHIQPENIKIVKPMMGFVAREMSALPASVSEAKESAQLVDTTVILFVAGNDQHKNLWRLLSLSKLLRQRGVVDVIFRMTVSEEKFVASCMLARVWCKSDYASEYFQFVGSLYNAELMALYGEADVVANLSDLESISNNFIEASAIGKPMLISDRDFSVNSVRVPYISCEPHNTESLYDAVLRCRERRFDTPQVVEPLCVSSYDRVRAVLRALEECVAQ